MDYTPTTEEMRQAWAGQLVQSATPNCFELIDEGQASAEFDRWLMSERARIWDECSSFWHRDSDPDPHNPYREPNA